MDRKYIFVTGGVMSSLGKGLTAASIGKLLEAKGLKIAMIKADPYLNVDPGTMNPFEHGEVYVTDDGAETDLDLGHYYRFTHSPLSQASNVTTGKIYETIIRKERKGDFLGKTVQVVPHVTDEIKRHFIACGEQEEGIDVVLVEIGGTVGDIESGPFMEAVRQFKLEHNGNCANIHITYVPYLPAAGEVKTKPTQHSVQMLRQIGVMPDVIVCRCEEPLNDELKRKISLFCSVRADRVVDLPDVEHSIYEVPLYLRDQGLDRALAQLLGMKEDKLDLNKWEKMVDSLKNVKGEVTIGIVGKYLEHADAYKSVFEALEHAAIAQNTGLRIEKIDADSISNLEDIKEAASSCDGILIPGGFGSRGWEGMILAAQYCRENKVPCFGICLGMQVICVEFARNCLRLKGANSTEMEIDCKEPVVSLLEEQHRVVDMGGTMRLGSFSCHLEKDSKAYDAYKSVTIHERHRHRWEFNNAYIEKFKEKGMRFVGMQLERDLVEVIEVKNHPWMVAVQYHPEFKSSPIDPHPLFCGLIKAMVK